MTNLFVILGKISRLFTILVLSILAFLQVLSLLLGGLVTTSGVPPVAATINRLISGIVGIIFIYIIFLLIKNNRKYLPVLGFSILIYYLYLTFYRLLFITNGKMESVELSNLLLFSLPVFLAYLSYRLEPKNIKSQESPKDLPQSNEPFTPLQYQGIIIRGLANLIDQLIIGMPFLLFISILGLANNEENYLFIGGVIFLIYAGIAEAIWGQTLGKKIFGIKVMMIDGTRCTPFAALIRNLLRIVDALLGGYLLAIIFIAITHKKQRIGDLLAHTVVIKP